MAGTPLQPFWMAKALDEMSDKEWESLCDGCGFCCLHKLQDDDTGEYYYTNIACRLLDSETIRCREYGCRQQRVPDCTRVTPKNVNQLDWLPDTCAYRRVAAGRDLPEWHHLKTGKDDSVHRAGKSVRGKIVAERNAGPLKQHLTDWFSVGD